MTAHVQDVLTRQVEQKVIIGIAVVVLGICNVLIVENVTVVWICV